MYIVYIVYICIHTYVLNIDTHMNKLIYINNVSVCIFIYVPVYIHIHICECTYVRTHTYVHVCICLLSKQLQMYQTLFHLQLCFLANSGKFFKKYYISFPRAIVTKYHKLSSLKQYSFIVSQLWWLDIWN